MRFHTPLLLAITALATAIPIQNPGVNEVVKRDGTAVINAVTSIAEKITALNTTITSYKGGLIGTPTALKIEAQSLSLSNELKAGIRTTEASDPFTDAESLHVAAAFLDLQPSIFSTLDNIVSKKPQFDRGLLGIASLAFLVKANLEQQKDLAGELGEAVAAKLTPVYAAIAPALNRQIAEKFTAAIEAFS